MHKLYWMKTEWDQARFSGLGKRFDPACAGRMLLKTSVFLKTFLLYIPVAHLKSFKMGCPVLLYE